MGRSKETSGKKEVRTKQLKKRKDKLSRKQDKKDQGKKSFDDMIAWVDENGQILSEPPTETERTEVEAEDIEVSVPKGNNKTKDPTHQGKVKHYDPSKGYGFIFSNRLNDTVFFHINDCPPEIKINDKVEFEVEKGPKGLRAVRIKILKG